MLATETNVKVLDPSAKYWFRQFHGVFDSCESVSYGGFVISFSFYLKPIVYCFLSICIDSQNSTTIACNFHLSVNYKT